MKNPATLPKERNKEKNHASCIKHQVIHPIQKDLKIKMLKRMSLCSRYAELMILGRYQTILHKVDGKSYDHGVLFEYMFVLGNCSCLITTPTASMITVNKWLPSLN